MAHRAPSPLRHRAGGRRRPAPPLALLVALLGCSAAPSPADHALADHPVADHPAADRPAASGPRDPAPALDLAALLPRPGGRFAPALTELSEGGPSGHVLADTDTCAACHPDVAAQWQASAHALASFNNPIYRAGVERFRAALGNERSRFCAGCHDPALLVDGAIDHPVDPRDPRAHVGVTCRTCHGIDRATFDGNGSYRLAEADLALPDPRDSASVARHRASVARPALRSGELCASCHRAFLDDATGHPVHFAGTDDVGPWLASPHGGSERRLDDPLPARACAECHMPREPATRGDLAAKAGAVASHRFPGGHTWLAAMRGDEESLAAARRLLEGAVRVDVAALTHEDGRRDLPAEAAELAPGERVVLDLVVRNLSVGHRFPGGTRDAQDTRIEASVAAADGRILAATRDPHVLRAGVLGDDGRPRDAREVEDLRVAAFDHTIAPRDAIVTRVAFTVPADLPPAAWPLRVDARVVHRSRTPELADQTCREGLTKIGRDFTRAAAARAGRLDPCAPPPATVVAAAALELGPGARLAPDLPTWRRLYELGLGLHGDVQERQELARLALERALDGARREVDPRAEAMVLAALAEVAAAQGRADDALALADQVAALLPEHPAADGLRALALAAVWRWPRSLAPLARLTAALPHDPRAWVQRAIAAGSAGVAEEALAAARAGLRLAPRDPDLLRVQALALRDLAASDHAAALAAYLAHRPADEAPRLRSRCSREQPGCARERLPVHEHALEAPDR